MPGVHAVITATDMPERAADHSDAAAAAAGVQAVRAAGDRRREGALCRRADRGRAGGQRRRSARMRSKRSRSRSRRCRRSRIGTSPSGTRCLLFEAAGTNRALIFNAVRGDADAAFRNAPYTRRENFRVQRHSGLTMEPRGVLAEWDAAKGVLTVSGAAKVPFFNRRILAKQIGLRRRRHRHDRERRRRRLRRARRVLSRGLPDSVRGAPCRPAGEVDRGPAREPDGDEPRARGGGRRRDRLRRATARSSASARRTPVPTGRLHAHQRRGRRRATSRSSWPGPIASRTSKLDVVVVDDQQDAGRHLSRARAGSRPTSSASGCSTWWRRISGIDRVEFRRRNLIAHSGDAVPDRDHRAVPTARTNTTAATIRSRSTVACRKSAGTRKRSSAGQADRRPLSRRRRRLLHRRRRRRAEGNRAARAQQATARSRSTSARRRSDRASRRSSRRSPPTRSKCRWTGSTASSTARPPMSATATAPITRARP